MNLKFEDAYNQYLIYIENRQKNQSKRTLKERFDKYIIPYFLGCNINDINDIKFISWQNDIEKLGFSFNYKRNLHYIFSGFLEFCVKFYNLSCNIAKKVGCFKNINHTKTEHDFYTYNEFRLFISKLDNNVYKQFFNFMFFTGTRPGETMALRFSDLNSNIVSISKTIDEHGKREVGTPKTYTSNRMIRIDKKLKKDLLNLQKYYQIKYNDFNYDYYIFGGKKPLAPTTINRYKEKACNLANIRKIKLHEFRHSHATLLLHKGVIIHEISKRLGHSDISITLNTYTHTNELQEKRVTRTLNLLRLFKTF